MCPLPTSSSPLYRCLIRTRPETLTSTPSDSSWSPTRRWVSGMRWVQVRPRGSVTSLTLVTWFPTMPAGSLKGTVLESDALESDIADLQGKGVKIGAIETAPWGRFVTFDDPEGNGIVLQVT